jgi:hypothetical protein
MERMIYIDEHAISLDASRAEAWSALLRVLCPDPEDPATLRFGRLEQAIPRERLILNGRHLCFANYRLLFEFDPEGDTQDVRLRVRTWATFFGLRGQVFRVLAVGGGAHRCVVRRMLRTVKSAAAQSDSDAKVAP